MTLRAWADTLLSLLLAPPCAVCGEVLAQPLAGAVCESCWRAIAPRPTRFTLRGIDHAGSLGTYESRLRDVIHALKYGGRRSIAPRLAGLMLAHAGEVLRGADAAVPVPLHPRRHRQRGFNQAADLARGLGLPIVHAVRRARATRPQVDLPAHARRLNVRNAFVPSGRGTHDWVAQKVLVLVDDVVTTGATLEACAAVLRHAGASDVRAITAARVATAPPP